ncbi:uncharacterized protein LOC143287039 isoform X2 [Babylonia areolata]|uniref:uncharacterized protein LOC143287039 isoform X2 n=1 Tax=Babylonia areolata TaxID=304850 RepID=UPI003FCFB523
MLPVLAFVAGVWLCWGVPGGTVAVSVGVRTSANRSSDSDSDRASDRASDSDSDRARRSLEDQCYNVGSCTPVEEPRGDEREICKIFEESLTCMQQALEACRQLDFPQDILAKADVQALREVLHRHCSDKLGPATDLVTPAEEDRGGLRRMTVTTDPVGDQVNTDADTESSRGEARRHSQPVQAAINSASRLPCHPALPMISLASLLSSALVVGGRWAVLS